MTLDIIAFFICASVAFIPIYRILLMPKRSLRELKNTHEFHESLVRATIDSNKPQQPTDPIRRLLHAWDAWRTEKLVGIGYDSLGSWALFCDAIDALRGSLAPRVWTQHEIDELTSVCWHCGDVLQGLGTHCEHCPAPGDCDDEDCEECADRKVGTRG